MAKEWIANLAQDIRQKAHQAAEDYGRSQHRAGIITAHGKPFFIAFVLCLEENISQITRELQGDVTASETTISTSGPTEVRLARSRFPWFDAHIVHQESIIVLDYAKGLGIAGDPALDRKVCHFDFQVADDDGLSVQQSFGDNPAVFHQPEQLARHITELLFHI